MVVMNKQHLDALDQEIAAGMRNLQPPDFPFDQTQTIATSVWNDTIGT